MAVKVTLVRATLARFLGLCVPGHGHGLAAKPSRYLSDASFFNCTKNGASSLASADARASASSRH